MKSFIGGLLLGSFLTLLGGLLLGSTLMIGDIQSPDQIGNNGRYDLRIDEADGTTRYSVIDNKTGTVTITTPDGKVVVVKAAADPVAEKDAK